MTKFYRHETAAKRFVRIMVEVLRMGPSMGTYRLPVYRKFITGSWNDQDAAIGQHACMWFGWITADVSNGFITLTEAGYQEAMDASFSIASLPSDDSFFEELFGTIHPVKIINSQEQNNRFSTATELGWIRFKNDDQMFFSWTKVVDLYLAGQISQEDCERYVVAQQLAEWNFDTIYDD